MRYKVINNFDEELYNNILNIAFDLSDCFSVCTFRYYHKKDLTENFFNFFDSIESYKTDEYKFSLPKNYTKGQKFHVYWLNQQTEKIIRSVGLFQNWIAPCYPEDLSFYRANKPWLLSITHENLIFIETSNKQTIKRFLDSGIVLKEKGF